MSVFTKNYLLETPKASIVIIHGLGEHCLRYAHVAEALNKIGMNVYTFDFRGHGQSEGTRALVDTHEYRQDLEKFYLTIPKTLPVFLLGHSMGGLIGLQFLFFVKRLDIKGVVLTGPAIAAGADISPFTRLLVRFLGKYFPKLKTQKLDPNSTSRDPEMVNSYATDPLIYHDGTRAGTGRELLRAIAEIKTQFKDFDYPVLLMHGEADKITNPEGSKSLFNESISADKTLKIWDGAYHEILNETNRKEVIEMMTDWLKKRL